MKVLYVTDDHGITWKRWRVFELAKQHRVQLIIDGGDILPYDNDRFTESLLVDRFFQAEMIPFAQQVVSAGIYYFFIPGNDDPIIFDHRFSDLCQQFSGRVFNLAQKRVQFGGYTFIGMSWVKDHPWRLKDRCRLDFSGDILEEQRGTALFSQSGTAWREIVDREKHVRQLPTMADELNCLPRPHNFKKAVYVIHDPPFGLKLGITTRGPDRLDVGSKSVRRFLEKTQPLISFHGHLHESPDLFGTWQARLGKTVCVQPGQGSRTRLQVVLIDLEDLNNAQRLVEDYRG